MTKTYTPAPLTPAATFRRKGGDYRLATEKTLEARLAMIMALVPGHEAQAKAAFDYGVSRYGTDNWVKPNVSN